MKDFITFLLFVLIASLIALIGRRTDSDIYRLTMVCIITFYVLKIAYSFFNKRNLPVYIGKILSYKLIESKAQEDEYDIFQVNVEVNLDGNKVNIQVESSLEEKPRIGDMIKLGITFLPSGEIKKVYVIEESKNVIFAIIFLIFVLFTLLFKKCFI
jgi:hypothetical protein